MTEQVPLETFRATAWSNRADLKKWDLYTALALAIVAPIVADKEALASLPDLYLAEVTGIAALFGFVIAGLAVMVAFLDQRFLTVVRQTDSGLVGALWPFWLVSALAVAAITASGAGIVLRTINCEPFQRLVFGITTLFAAWALFCSLRLVQYIVSQGVNRTIQFDDAAPVASDTATAPGGLEHGAQRSG